MTENKHSEGTPSSDEVSSGDVAAVFQNLGQNLKEFFQTAWESEERQIFQQEVEASLSEFASSLNTAVTEFKESPSGQQLKSDMDDFHTRVKSGEVETRAREEFLSVLHQVNAELEKVAAPKKPPASAVDKPVEES